MADARNRADGGQAHGNENSSDSSAGNAGHICLRCGGSAEGKNLVVCIDGTSNKFSINNTNIVELYRHLKSDDSQLTYYNSGIGTHARPSFRSARYWRQAISHNIDLAFAWKFEKIVIAAYRWLADNYRTGDRIYLFGFSRGAYQVRVLSAMIDKVGLIRRGNEEQIPFAFELYSGLPRDDESSDSESENDDDNDKKKKKIRKDRNRSSELFNFMKQSSNANQENTTNIVAKRSEKERSGPTGSVKVSEENIGRGIRMASVEPVERETADIPPGARSYSDRDPVRLARTFKRTFCRDSVKAHFVGVWDTVSSVGIVRDKVHPHTADGMHHTCFFRHALALDERRVKFLPEYVHGGTALPHKPPSEEPRQPYTKERPHVKEVWFRGSHSDIGGGNAENVDLNRGDPPLRWMSYEAIQAGLLMSTFEGSKNEGWDKFQIKLSMRGIWWALELLPLRRLSYRDPRDTTWIPHLGRGRIIKPGQLIHSTVIRAEDPEGGMRGKKAKRSRYKPRAALPLELRDWDDYRGSERDPKKEPFIKVELDLMNVSEILVTRLRGAPESKVALKELESALKSAEHSRALYDLTQLHSNSKDKPKKDKLLEMEKPMSEVLSESFQHVIQDILKPSTSSAYSISLSITPDIRLYALCVRVLNLPQAVPVSEVRLWSNASAHSQGDADVHFSIDRDTQKLELSFMGPEFWRGEQGRLLFKCSVDNTKTVSTILRRASQFFTNLRCMPAAPEGVEIPEAEFTRTNPPPGKAAKTWKVRDDETIIKVGSLLDGGNDLKALYKCSFYNRDQGPMYPYLFEFGAGLAFGSFEPDNVDLPVPPNVAVRTSDLHFDPWGPSDSKKVVFHKIIWTNKEVPALKSVPFVSIDRVMDLSSQVEDWKPIPVIPTILAEAGAEWFAQQYVVLQDDLVLQDSLNLIDAVDLPPPATDAQPQPMAPDVPEPEAAETLPEFPDSHTEVAASVYGTDAGKDPAVNTEYPLPEVKELEVVPFVPIPVIPSPATLSAKSSKEDIPRAVIEVPPVENPGSVVPDQKPDPPATIGSAVISYVGQAIGIFSG